MSEYIYPPDYNLMFNLMKAYEIDDWKEITNYWPDKAREDIKKLREIEFEERQHRAIEFYKRSLEPQDPNTQTSLLGMSMINNLTDEELDIIISSFPQESNN